MHTYEALWSESGVDDDLSIADARFRDALDVVAWAQRNCAIGSVTFPYVWQLDEYGAICSHYRAFTGDSIHTWAADPNDLLVTRSVNEASGDAFERWLIIESRQTWRCGRPLVDERDAAAFLSLRATLALDDVELLDAVVFDDERHWWSMHELTSGTTAWGAVTSDREVT